MEQNYQRFAKRFARIEREIDKVPGDCLSYVQQCRADDVQSMHVAARPFDQGRSSFTSHLPRGILMDLPYTRICVQSLYLRVVSNLLSLALT